MALPVRVLSGLGIALGCAALLVGLVAGEGVVHLARSHGGHAPALMVTPSPLLTAVAFVGALLLGVAGLVCLYAAARAHDSRTIHAAQLSPRDEARNHQAVTL